MVKNILLVLFLFLGNFSTAFCQTVASVNPGPNLIPKADLSGHIKPSWLASLGQGGFFNCDSSGSCSFSAMSSIGTVTPADSAVPKANTSGHLTPDWLAALGSGGFFHCDSGGSCVYSNSISDSLHITGILQTDTAVYAKSIITKDGAEIDIRHPDFGGTFSASGTCSAGTDVFSAIQAAYNYCATLGRGVVVLPPGTCDTSAELDWSQSYCGIKGAGQQRTWLRRTFVSGDTIKIYKGSGSGNRVDGFSAKDLSFASSVKVTNGNHLNVDNAAYGTVENVEFQGSLGGILLQGGFNWVFHHAPVYSGNGYTAGVDAVYGYKITGSTNSSFPSPYHIYLDRCDVDQNGGGYLQHGYIIEASDGVWLSNYHINHTWDTDVHFEPQNNWTLDSVFSMDQYLDGNSNPGSNAGGLDFIGTSTGAYGYIKFRGGSILGQKTGLTGVIINSASLKDLDISGVTIARWNGHGINYLAGTGIKIDGNTITMNNASAGSYNQINIGPSLSDWEVLNNNIGTTFPFDGGTAAVGIAIDSGNTNFSLGPQHYGPNNIIKVTLGAGSVPDGDYLTGLSQGLVVARNAVQASHTGDTNETALATIPVPAGLMGANGRLRVTVFWSYTNSANNKVLNIRFGASGAGLTGTIMSTNTQTTTADHRGQTEICNRNSVSSQIAFKQFNGFFSTATALATSAINTDAASEIVISGQLANSGETVAIEAYLVELIK